MAATRLVDAYLPSQRTKPMDLLCLGMCRTGTESLNAALIKLGYTPHKVQAVMKDMKKNVALWEEAFRAHYDGVGERYGRAELDVLLGDYDSLLDLPPVLLVEELVAAYPDAKVVLSLRDEDSWLASMRDTAGRVVNWWTYPYIWQFHEPTRIRVGFAWNLMHYLCNKDLSDAGPARQRFRDHNALVRSLVPPERLLEHRATDGWAPLCRFLGKDAPDEPYPNINDRAFLRKLHAFFYYYCLSIATVKVGAMVLTPIVVGRYALRYMRGN